MINYKNMRLIQLFVLLMTIFIFGSNCCNIFQFIETAHADPLVSIILDEGFEDIFPPIGWTNTGWVDSLYGFPHGGSSWAYSWAKGDTLTTKILSFGTHTNTDCSFSSIFTIHTLLKNEKIFFGSF